MDSDLRRPQQQWQIEQGAALSFDGRDVGAVTSQLGTVWLTRTGTATDYFLAAGERHHLEANARHIVIEAIDGRACIEITQRTPKSAPQVQRHLRAALARALHRFARWIDAPRAQTCPENASLT